MTLKIQRLTPTAALPERATGQSAGLDLRADIGQAVTLPPGGASVFPTGLAIALPERTVGLIFGRSGLGIKHGIAPSNAVGVIDADYRGEIRVGPFGQALYHRARRTDCPARCDAGASARNCRGCLP